MATDRAIQRAIDILSVRIIEDKRYARELDPDDEEKDDINIAINELDEVRTLLGRLLNKGQFNEV